MELTVSTYFICTFVDIQVWAQGMSGCKEAEVERRDVLCIL